MLLHTLAGIAWDPQLRGFLALAVGVVVLMGSVYLLLSTNLGTRLGFLLGSAAFFGWLMLMGLVWWVYGTIGMLGEAPRWEVTEVVYPGVADAALEEAHTLDTSGLPSHEEVSELTEEQLVQLSEDIEDDSGWSLLPESNPSFGEAKATVDEYLAENPLAAVGDEEFNGLDDPTEYLTLYSFERGGKEGLPEDPTRTDRIVTKLRTTFVELQHPPHYAVIQVQPVRFQETEPGQPPPSPEADPDQPVVSVIMERNLGDVRFPGAMLTIFSGIVFGVLCLQLHVRDRRVAEVRGLVPTTTRA
jgi:hypothetical protein